MTVWRVRVALWSAAMFAVLFVLLLVAQITR